MTYLEISRNGAVIEQDPDNERHRYLINEGYSTFESVGELSQAVTEAQHRVGWLKNDREY